MNVVTLNLVFVSEGRAAATLAEVLQFVEVDRS